MPFAFAVAGLAGSFRRGLRQELSLPRSPNRLTYLPVDFRVGEISVPDAPIAFFSYSREDSEFALRLANDLRAAGSAVWIDQLDIGPGQRWDRVVQTALESCPSVLVILSPASVNSNNVMDEVSFALDQQKALIPVLYRDCDIPFRLRRFQHLDFTGDYDRMLEELRKCLHIAGEAKSATPAGTAATTVPASASSAATTTASYRAPAPAPVERAAPPAYVQPSPATASSFPAWTKIAIPVAVVLIAIVAYMLMSSKSPTPDNTKTHTQAENAAGNSSGDAGSTNRAALGSVELWAQGWRPCRAPRHVRCRRIASRSSPPAIHRFGSSSLFGAVMPAISGPSIGSSRTDLFTRPTQSLTRAITAATVLR